MNQRVEELEAKEAVQRQISEAKAKIKAKRKQMVMQVRRRRGFLLGPTAARRVPCCSCRDGLQLQGWPTAAGMAYSCNPPAEGPSLRL